MTMTTDSFKPQAKRTKHSCNPYSLDFDPFNSDCDDDTDDSGDGPEEDSARPRGPEKVYTAGSDRWSVTGDEMLAKPRPKLRPVDVSSAPRKGSKK